MPVRYALFPNQLTEDPNDYMAVVQNQVSRTIEDIINIMIGRGSTVTKAEALSVIEEYEAAIAQILANGDNVSTPIFRISASVPGVFTSIDDRFDRSRHHVRLNIHPGPRIGQIAEELPVEKVPATERQPILQRFKDVASDTINETLTPGAVGELFGSLLKIDPEDAEQGIFLIAADGTATKAETLVRNKPANLIFMIPDTLESGEYIIEVRNKPGNISEIRSGSLNMTLIV
ncbi:DNA-binding domain-containing protein [Sinomicrobium sp. M5D2P17]